MEVDGQRVYWQTGSRVLCLAPGEPRRKAEVKTIRAKTERRVEEWGSGENEEGDPRLRSELVRAIDEWLSDQWLPLFVEPGLSGREFFFESNAEAFEAMAYAFRYLPADLQERVKEKLRAELEQHPPFAVGSGTDGLQGRAREWFQVPNEYRSQQTGTKNAHAFGHLWQPWLWAKNAGEEKLFLNKSKAITESYRAFRETKWRLDPEKGDLYANRYIASLSAFEQIAERLGETGLAREAGEEAKRATESLIAWWKRAAHGGTMGEFKGSTELDPFITRGDAISFKVAPHKHKIALFADLSPELFSTIHREAPDAVLKVWQTFEELYKTWPLQGEERQVHFGENFVDPPDLAVGGFKVLKWMGHASVREVRQAVDLPSCLADLFYIQKLALAQ